MNDQGHIFTIIGAGNMGTAILAGILRNGLTVPQNVRATGRREEHLAALREQFGISTYTDNAAAVAEADVVLLCVKPQHLDPVMQELVNHLPAKTLVISIVAGVRMAKLSKGLNHG